MSDKSPKIRIIHSDAGTGWGGQQIRIVTECLKQVEAGNSVAIICTPGSAIERKASEFGIPTFSLKMKGITDLGGIMRIRQFLRSFSPDILNTHSSGDSWMAQPAALLAGGIKIVRTRHSARGWKKSAANSFIYKKTCDYITTTGNVLRQQMIDSLGIPPDRIMSIPSGVDLDQFRPENADGQTFRREIGVPDGVPLIGTVCMIYPVKGLDYFIEAAAKVASERKDARFVIVGDIPSPDCAEYKEKLLDLIKKYGLTDKVFIPGFRSDIPNVMAALDIFVLPSLNEGMPQVLMQAMAMERPSISTNVGSVSELITDGETGLLIPKEDAKSIAKAISSLLSDREKTREMGRNARIRVEQGYSITAMMEKTHSVYDSLLSS